MDPATAVALGAGGISALGSMWSNVTNLGEGRRARQFAERMSGTAYQRAVVDMQLAGLNPMLAYGQGGASTPGAPMGSVDDALSPAVSSAQGARRLSQELKLMQQQTARQFVETQDILPAQKAVLQSQAKEAAARTALARRESMESVARTKGHLMSTALQGADLPAALVRGQAASGKFGTVTEYMRRLFGSVSPAIGAIGGGAVGAAIGRFRRAGSSRPTIEFQPNQTITRY